MKKLWKLLALTLAVVMLLPAAALAAEDGGTEPSKELLIQWLNWEEDPQPESEIHFNNPMAQTPYDEAHIALYTNEEKPIPVDKVTASAGLIIEPLCPGVKGKEHYARITYPEEWNKTYTLSYDGCAMTIEVRLPDIGLYSAPEATIDNYIWNQCLGYSPLMEDRSAYIICTSTDETRGRHLTNLVFTEDCADNDSFKLEKVSDNVYKVTLTGSIDADHYEPQMTVTWQNVSFMGGNSYEEPWGFGSWGYAGLLVSDKPTPKYNQMETFTNYADVKANFTNTMTLKAGESKTAYLAFTFFPGGDQNNWIVRNTSVEYLCVSDDALKVTADAEDMTKFTLSCDVPGTYQLIAYNEAHPVLDALYHENGTKYTDAEVDKLMAGDFSYGLEGKELVVYTDRETWESVPFAEAFPDLKDVEFHVIYRDPWLPITVTVESDKLPFTDVPETQWYVNAVRFVNSKGLMNGSSATKFNPTGKITGAEFAQILYNKAGKPAAADGASFQGVTEQWYAPAVLWCAGEGIITDTGDAAVEPAKDLTRQQIALMLYNAMGKPAGTADLSAFTDADQIAAWAKPAMEWAVSAKVFQGSNGKLTPASTATRAEVAQILMNYFG